MATQTKKSGFSGSIGFVLAAAGSAVGVGNIWRFPTLAAKHGGGLFLVTYIGLILIFGFSLLITDIAIGRKTGKSSIEAFKSIHPKWSFLGKLTFLVPSIILCYYVVIGGWILKYMVSSVTEFNSIATGAPYFMGFITSKAAPIFWMFIYLAITAIIVYCGVEKGIERFSKIIMPALLVIIIGISIFTLTLSHTDENGTRTGLQGLKEYIIPKASDFTFKNFMGTLIDAVGHLFFSLSVSMGIMITYGSYVKKDVDLNKSVKQIEIFDTVVAFLAGVMVIPAMVVFKGGITADDGGAGLVFVSLAEVFDSMGFAGRIVGPAFFVMIAFAALTSSVSIMEAVVGSCMETFKVGRKKVCLIVTAIATLGAIVVCLGYNALYFDLVLPSTGKPGQLLDVLDYLTNNLMMPIISICTCILIGWVVKPKWIIDEIESSGCKFGRKKLYTVMIKYVAPALMVLVLLQAFGVFGFLSK